MTQKHMTLSSRHTWKLSELKGYVAVSISIPHLTSEGVACAIGRGRVTSEGVACAIGRVGVTSEGVACAIGRGGVNMGLGMVLVSNLYPPVLSSSLHPVLLQALSSLT